jgi:heme/copper-type cytochrome/quinol oxidase subunit 2
MDFEAEGPEIEPDAVISGDEAAESMLFGGWYPGKNIVSIFRPSVAKSAEKTKQKKYTMIIVVAIVVLVVLFVGLFFVWKFKNSPRGQAMMRKIAGTAAAGPAGAVMM